MSKPGTSRRCKTVLAVASVCVAAGTSAARVIFDPSLELGARATDNISYQGSGSGDASDTIGIVAATFQVSQIGQDSELNFRYRPELQRYQDFDVLDHDEHRADLDWSTGLGRRARFGAEANYSLTQTQGVPQMLDDPALFLSERTDRQYGRVRVNFERNSSRIWSWNLAADAETYRFDPIEDLAAPPGTTIEDRDEYGGEFGMSRQHSAATAIGGLLRWERFNLETSGSENTTSLAATWRYALARTMNLIAETGVFHNTGEAGVDDEERYGLHLYLEFERDWAARQLRLRLENGPSSGGALNGSDVESRLTLAYGSNDDQTWSWAVEPHAARRDPTEENQDALYALGARFTVGRWFGEHFEGHFEADYFDQSDDNSVASAGVFLSWHPMRRRFEREGQGEGVGEER